MRDVCVLYHERLGLMLREDDPVYPNWDQDLTAVEEDYRGQEPGAVAAQQLEAQPGWPRPSTPPGGSNGSGAGAAATAPPSPSLASAAT